MTEETFYRHMADNGIPCPHCGEKLNIFEVVMTYYCIGGSLPKKCKHCNSPLTFYEWRDYGVERNIHQRQMLHGWPRANHERRPLWAIPSDARR